MTMNGFLKDMTYVKSFLTTFIIVGFWGGATYFKIDTHINNLQLHTVLSDRLILENIKAHGFTFSADEKIEILRRIGLNENDIQNIFVQLDDFEAAGRFQTPSEKEKAFYRMLDDYFKSKTQ